MAKLPRPPRPIPVLLELLPPPTAPPAVAEFEEPPPPMKMMRLFPYAVSRVFSGMDRAWAMAWLTFFGLHVAFCVLCLFCFVTYPEVAPFWIWIRILIFEFFVCLGIIGIAAILLRLFVEEPAASEEQLPSPPPEMDLC